MKRKNKKIKGLFKGVVFLGIFSIVVMLSANLFMNVYGIEGEMKYYAIGFLGHQLSIILLFVAFIFLVIEFYLENKDFLKGKK